MLSYLHSYHAGNHADIIKHITLLLTLNYMKNKDKPFVYIDTHAGRGYYNLNSKESNKTGEYHQGIEKILNNRKTLEPAIQDYLNIIREINAELISKERNCAAEGSKCKFSQLTNEDNSNTENINNHLSFYPGSPYIAKKILRTQDQLILMELHNNEITELKTRTDSRNDNRITVHHRDGFEGLVAITPPKIKRGVILIDPSYEISEDYSKAINTVEKVLKKWNNVTIILWYPHLGNDKDHSLYIREKARKIEAKEILDVNFCIGNPRDGFEGLYGSGLLIFNPAYNLYEQLKQIVVQLHEVCSQTENALSCVTKLS